MNRLALRSLWYNLRIVILSNCDVFARFWELLGLCVEIRLSAVLSRSLDLDVQVGVGPLLDSLFENSASLFQSQVKLSLIRVQHYMLLRMNIRTRF